MPHATPLADEHRTARTAEDAGWQLPADFGDPAAEYRAALEGAALFDRSHAGKLELTGPDAPSFLQNISTNEVKSLPLGGGCETYFCDHRAKALFHAFAFHVRLGDGQDAIWLEVTPGFADGLLAHLDKYRISEQVEFANRTADFAQMHLAGPRATAVLAEALGAAVPDLGPLMHMERTFGSTATCSVRRHDRLGVPGYDLVCLNERAAGVWRMLRAAGAVPAGGDAYDVLRVEAGTPEYGRDVDDSRFVLEVRGALERAVSYQKGCFLGQEPIVMARDRAGHVNRALLGLKLPAGESAPAGARVLRDGKEVGTVTGSRVESPALGAGLALAYVRRGNQDPGTAVEVERDGGPLPAEVVGLPVR